MCSENNLRVTLIHPFKHLCAPVGAQLATLSFKKLA
jgi:hypothetical protein